MTDHDLSEAKRLVADAANARSLDAALVNLTLAVNILIGLVEGHRHEYVPHAKAVYDRDTVEYPVTGPMQARQ